MSRSRRAAAARTCRLAAASGAGFAGLVLLLYFTSSHLHAATSDSATVVLEGQAIANGQILLHGWNLTFASYWTSTAAFDAVAVVVDGLRAGLMYAVPAFAGALAISGGVMLARDGRPGMRGLAGSLAVVVLLGCSTPAMAFFFIGHGFHVGTAAYALFALVALRRGRFGWGWVAAVLLLSAGLLGDLLMLAYGVVPLVVAGIAEMVGQRRWRAGLPEVAAGFGSLVLSGVARLVCVALGTYDAAPGLRVARLSQIASNLGHVPVYASSLLGLTNSVMTSGGVPAEFRHLRGLGPVTAIGALVVLASFAYALASLVTRLVRGRQKGQAPGGEASLWRLDDLLVIAVISSPVPFVLLAGSRGAGIRYLTVTVIFAVVLSGRMVARAFSKLGPGLPLGAFAASGILLAMSLVASYGVGASGPQLSNPTTGLVSWLEAHDLRNGIGGYWVASISTVESDGEVTVRPVLGSRDGGIERAVLASASWYENRRFQFLVEGAPPGYVGVVKSPEAWGVPEHTYVVGRYRVLVWSHELSVPSVPMATGRHTSASQAVSVRRAGSRAEGQTTGRRRLMRVP